MREDTPKAVKAALRHLSRGGPVLKGKFVVVRVSRMNRPPRVVETELYCVTPVHEGWMIEMVPLDPVTEEAIEDAVPHLANVARDLCAHWPENSRPESIAIMTDGAVIAFNPGRPNGRKCDWLLSHLAGASPCVLIGGKADAPFGMECMQNATRV